MAKTIEEIAYEELCENCESAKYCHEECEECDRFLDLLEELEAKNNGN